MSYTTAYASETSAYVTDTKTGGGGRRGYAGAAGGGGSTLSNSVSGKTTGGTLELTQTGRGYGVAAADGARKSYLTFNDFSANLMRAASFTGTSNAYGGNGGNGGTPGGTTSVAAMTAAVRHSWRTGGARRHPGYPR